MPLSIIDKKYTDVNSVNQGFLFANAGDNTQITLKLMERIEVVGNLQNNLSINFFDSTITWAGGNWMKEGFIIGDVINIKKISSVGATLVTDQATIIAFSGATNSIMQISYGQMATTLVPNIGNGEFLYVGMATDYRAKELLISVNYVASGSTGNEFSLIDGEPTIFSFNIGAVAGFPYIPNNTILNGIQVGNKSGTFNTTALIKFSNATPASLGFAPGFGVIYELIVQSVNTGPLMQTYFDFSNNIKLNIKLEYARVFQQPFNRNYFYFSDDAQTGWYNEPYNTGIENSQLISSTGDVAYDSSSQIICTINELGGSISNAQIAVGAMYVSSDESYYKNKPYSLSRSMMMRASFLSLGSYSQSTSNIDGALFIMNAVVSGTTTKTITINIVPNVQFGTFFESMEEGNRLFYVWVKVGTINHLVFNGQLISAPPIAGVLPMINTLFLDHSENIITSVGNNLGYQANKEDDLGYVGTFLLEKNATYDNLLVKIKAQNSVTGDNFSLLVANFNFNSVPIVNGMYVLPISQPIITTLPNTSVKEIAVFSLNSAYDTATEYGVEIYFPFLLRWEYWLTQSNANNAFYPNLNKDWVQYNQLIDWQVKLHLQLTKDGLGYYFDDIILIKDYDSSININQTIDVYLDSTNQLVTNVVSNSIHRVLATHTRIDLSAWVNPWAMVTIEAYESAPRWICSSVVPFDNNSQNPLTDYYGGVTLNLFFPSPHICYMECLFDSSKINVANGVKFTTKIKDC